MNRFLYYSVITIITLAVLTFTMYAVSLLFVQKVVQEELPLSTIDPDLRFEDFSVTNGSDLFVTLNRSGKPNEDHVLVEALKSNQGDQNYDVSKYDLSEFNSVSIYCKAFTT